MLSLAVFYFVFLGTEYLFDNRMALCTDPTGVVLAQSYILGVSVLGFLAYSLIEKQKSKYENPAAFKAGGFLVSGLTLAGYGLLLTRTAYGVLLGTGAFLFLVLGYLGAAAHYRAAVRLHGSKHPAKTIGVAYALGLLLQFLNHNLLWGETVEGVILAVSFVVLCGLNVGVAHTAAQNFHRGKKTDDRESVREEADNGEPEPLTAGEKICGEDICAEKNTEEGAGQMQSGTEKRAIEQFTVTGETVTVKNSRMAGVALLLTIVLMTCIFATLDNAVTLAHAAGTMDIGQWPRLFLAFSGLLAGVLFDLHSGRYRGLIMYAVTILSTICVLIIESGGPFLPGLLIFYVSAGFFVVFFTNGFLQLSYRMQDGKLWAGMGRAANNLGAVITGVASVSLLTGDSHVLTAVLALVLFVLISASLLWYYDCMQIVIGKAEDGAADGIVSGIAPDESTGIVTGAMDGMSAGAMDGIVPEVAAGIVTGVASGIVSGAATGMAAGAAAGQELCPEATVAGNVVEERPGEENSRVLCNVPETGGNTGSTGQLDGESGAEALEEMEIRQMSGRQSRMQRFAEYFELTEREQEVLQILLLSDDGMQEIADSLFVSRAMLYRHIAALNEKTGTKSRIGLIQFYYNWEEDKK